MVSKEKSHQLMMRTQTAKLAWLAHHSFNLAKVVQFKHNVSNGWFGRGHLYISQAHVVSSLSKNDSIHDFLTHL